MGIKQSAGDVKFFADLMINAAKDRKIYIAVDALMDPSFCLSTPGASPRHLRQSGGLPRFSARLVVGPAIHSSRNMKQQSA